ncbi:MAG: tRNA pseudouridine synthase A [Planctomycetales bacterium]
MASSRNIRLTLAYDGTNYCGWQVQSNGPSIQAALERGIERLTGERSPVFSAGRTDSGVHALGQVANFHTQSSIPASNFRSALQTKLPEDIVLLDACEAPPEFHATFSAIKKQYRYVIDNSPVSLPFLKRFAWQLRRELEAQAMHRAAQWLLGRHDFRSFETDWPNKVTSVRTVLEISVTRRPMWELWEPDRQPIVSPPVGGEPAARAAPGVPFSPGIPIPSPSPTPGPSDVNASAPLICLDITADGFLYNMVRSIVGTLVNVGRGKWPATQVVEILNAQKRCVAGSTAPPQGLYLVQVWYP